MNLKYENYFTNNNNYKNKNTYIENNNIFWKDNKNIQNESLYKEYKFPSLEESFNKAKDFLNKCSKGILINNKTEFKSSLNPKVSVIIPIYNSEKFINRAIKSVQNQDLLDLEIILINDFSTDNTQSVIEEIKKEDQRIKIINNIKNMGILYSRSIGVLSSKGKYIFSLDNDDMFLDFDVFSTITNIADEGNIDVVEYRGVMSEHASDIINTHVRDILSTKPKSFVLLQPELSFKSIQKGKDYDSYKFFSSVFMWCKCIKSNIYKQALNKIGEEKYSRFMIAHEDAVASFIIFNTAYSYKYVLKYSIYNIIRYGSGISIAKQKQITNKVKELYLADFVLDYARNTSNYIEAIPALTFCVLNIDILEKIIKEDEKYEKLLYSYLKRVLNLNYISDLNKTKILIKIKSLNFLDYSKFNSSEKTT